MYQLDNYATDYEIELFKSAIPQLVENKYEWLTHEDEEMSKDQIEEYLFDHEFEQWLYSLYESQAENME